MFDLEKNLKEEREIRYNKESAFILEKDKLIREHQTIYNQLKLENEKQLDEIQILNKENQNKLQAEFDVYKQEWEIEKSNYEH